MSILSVDQIQPIGSGTTVTLNATEVKTGTEITVGTGASIFSPAGNTLTFGTNNEERIRIKNDGSILIGTTTEGNSAANNLTIADSGSCGITIRSASSGTGNIYFSDAPAGAAQYDGYIQYNQNDRYLVLGTATAERLRIASDGRVTTSTTGVISQDFGTTSSTGAYLHFDLGANGANIGYMGAGNQLITGATTADLGIRAGANLVFSTGGTTERLRIGSAGQIGIAGANYGDAGQVLTSQGSGSPVQWASLSGWVFGTAADYDQWNSTSDVRLSGWPTNWQQIRISFTNISSNNNTYIQFFVSKSSDTNNKITSGYENKSGHFGASQTIDNDSNSAIMGRFMGTASSGYSLTGHVNFYNFRGDTIRYEGQCSTNNAAFMYITNGKVTCDPTSQMTHIFFRCQGYSYDSGKFKIDYLYG